MTHILTAAFAGFSTAAFLATASLAGETATPMTAAEIEVLLSGNTIEGTWSGSNYVQYFDANGDTVYIQENSKPDPGRWRVNSETNQYESWWEQTGWTPYTLLKTEGGYAWKNGDKHEPFTVKDGKHITW